MDIYKILDKYKLTDKQKAFIVAYTDSTDRDCFNNATQAVVKAGYKNGSTIRTQAHKLLKTQAVRDAIADINAHAKVSQSITLEWLKEQYVSLHNESLKASDRTNAKGALDSLTRMLGGFTDVSKVETTDKTPKLDADERKSLADIAKLHNIKLSG